MFARVFADASYHHQSQTAFWYGIVEFPDRQLAFEGTFRGCESSEGAEVGAVLLTVRSALRHHQLTRVQVFTDCEGAAKQLRQRANTSARPDRAAWRGRLAELLPADIGVEVVVVNKRGPVSRERELIIQCDRAAYRMYQSARTGRRPGRVRKAAPVRVPRHRPVAEATALWRALPGGGLRCPGCQTEPPGACRLPRACAGPEERDSERPACPVSDGPDTVRRMTPCIDCETIPALPNQPRCPSCAAHHAAQMVVPARRRHAKAKPSR